MTKRALYKCSKKQYQDQEEKSQAILIYVCHHFPTIFSSAITSPIMALFIIILMGYAVIKVFFANLKRGGILLIQIAVGSLYMFSVPRGYIDGFIQWTKQIIGLCLTAFLQATILTAGLLVVKEHALLGLGAYVFSRRSAENCGCIWA